MPKAKKNKNPYKDLPLNTVVKIGDLELRVAIQNIGKTWFSPTADEEKFSKDDPSRFLLQGLVVLQANEDGTIKDVYQWKRAV